MNWQEVVEIASGDVRRLSAVVRYSSIPVVAFENVAEHSYWVALYALMIHREMRPDDMKTIGAVVTKALIHDMAECTTGDVVRTFKYSSDELKQAINNAEDKIIENFPERIRDLYQTSHLLSGGNEGYVEHIVKAADFLSLHQYMRREVRRGNQEIGKFYSRMITDLENQVKKYYKPEIGVELGKLHGLYNEMLRTAVSLREATR